MDDGFTERTAALESSITTKNGVVHVTDAPLPAVAETVTANEATECGEFTRKVATVVDELDGSKYELRIDAGKSDRDDCRGKETLGYPPIGKFFTTMVI